MSSVSLLMSLLFLFNGACAKDPQAWLEPKKKSLPPPSSQMLAFYQQNWEYSEVFLRNVLDEKADIAQRAQLQNEKRQAAQDLVDKQDMVKEQKQIVTDLRKKKKDLESGGQKDDLKKVEQDLLVAENELQKRQLAEKEAKIDAEKKSQAFEDFSAAVKVKIDELNEKEAYSDWALYDLYKTL